MKRKIFITGITVVSLIALLGCQQKQPVAQPGQPETKTSTATLTVTPPTQQPQQASLQVLPPTSEVANQIGVMMKNGKMTVLMRDGSTSAMDKTLTLSDGTQVMTDGTVVVPGGVKKAIVNGMGITMDGVIVPSSKLLQMVTPATKK